MEGGFLVIFPTRCLYLSGRKRNICFQKRIIMLLFPAPKNIWLKTAMANIPYAIFIMIRRIIAL